MIKELAPFSSTFTFLAGQKCSKADISGTRFNGLTTSCMQSLHQRNTILKEVKNLSSALLQKQDLLVQAVKRFKEERKKHKRAAKQKNLIEMKKRDQIDYLQKRIEDLKRNEELLIQDLQGQQRCANEALHSLEILAEKFEDDKGRVKQDTEQKYQELMVTEKEKFEIKVKYLMSLNETLN